MFASVRQYRLDPTDYTKVVPRVQSEFIPMVRTLEGFVSYQVVMDPSGNLMSITTFVDEAGCRRSEELAGEVHYALMEGMMIELVSATIGAVVMHAQAPQPD